MSFAKHFSILVCSQQSTLSLAKRALFPSLQNNSKQDAFIPLVPTPMNKSVRRSGAHSFLFHQGLQLCVTLYLANCLYRAIINALCLSVRKVFLSCVGAAACLALLPLFSHWYEQHCHFSAFAASRVLQLLVISQYQGAGSCCCIFFLSQMSSNLSANKALGFSELCSPSVPALSQHCSFPLRKYDPALTEFLISSKHCINII